MNKKGNVFLAIIGILSVLGIMAVFFMNSTVQEKHQTERSHVSTEAQCLAEAALERALGILQKELNETEKFKDANHIACWLRSPMNVKGAAGFSSGIGEDQELDSAAYSKKIVLKKEDLEAGDYGNDLTRLVAFMAGEKATFEVEVSIELDKAFSVSPDSADGDYAVPGVDIPWNCHSGVKEFFSNEGFVALTLSLPQSFEWLSFKIDNMFFSIDVAALLDQFAKWCGFDAMSAVLEWRKIDTLLKNVLPDSIYPYEIDMAKDIFPNLSDKTALSMPTAIDKDKRMEKYGMLKIESKGTIIFPGQNRVTKTIFATKEFKCADVEPIAPMYSLFIANLHNERLVLNDIGGDLTVNNFRSFSSITSDPADPEKREFPGLVRVNGTSDMPVNVAFIGNPAGPKNYENDSGIKRTARGAEWLLILSSGVKGVGKTKEFQKNFTTKPIAYVPPNTSVPPSAQGAPSGGSSAPPPTPDGPPQANPNDSTQPSDSNDGKASMKDKLNSIMNVAKINIIPNKLDFGVSPFEMPLHFMADNFSIGGLRFKDPMVKWEWPMMGMGWSQLRVPFPTPARTVTHFFGDSALFPTLTREVEGFVLKCYRQWHFCLLGFPMGPIPLGNQVPAPFPPPFSLLPPFPTPYWHTHDIQDKYGYNFGALKSPKNNAGVVDEETNVYDPSFFENSPPNLYSSEQYVKKSAYYYPTANDFYDDILNRAKDVNGKKCLNLNGFTYVADSIILPPPVAIDGMSSDVFYVTGRGGIVCGGNVILKGNVEDPYSDTEERAANTPRTVFSLIVRSGGVILDDGPENIKLEGSLFTDKGMAIPGGKSLNVVGNWVTNAFSKIAIQGDLRIDHVGYKTRNSMTSINPDYGVYDPERYVVSLAPGYSSIRIK